jgi:putative transposase
MHLFRKEVDFEAFQRVMVEAHQRQPIRVLSYCVLSNHWHFVVWPEQDGQLTDFFRWLAHTHAMRWRVSHRTVGYGRLYQGRFKSFPVQCDDHLLSLLRYVERNPLSAGLVERAELWRWSSLWSRAHGERAVKALLSPWPVARPANWTVRVNSPLTAKELDRVRVSMARGRPYGADDWVRQTVNELGLQHTVRPEGRPNKASQFADEMTNSQRAGSGNAKRKSTRNRTVQCPHKW